MTSITYQDTTDTDQWCNTTTVSLSGSETTATKSPAWFHQLDHLLFDIPDGYVDSVISENEMPTCQNNFQPSLSCHSSSITSDEVTDTSKEETTTTTSARKTTTTTTTSDIGRKPLPLLKTRMKKMAKNNNSLKRERRFVCTSKGCGKSFAKKWNLQAHERLHSGYKPFECRIGCGEQFMWTSSLKSHERRKCTLLPASQRMQRKNRSKKQRPEAVAIIPHDQGIVPAPSKEDKLLFEMELENIIAQY